MTAVDEIVFHRILARHHFYDRATPQIGLLSDGLLHSAAIVVLAAGGIALADLLRPPGPRPQGGVGRFLLGAGGSQLFDGTVDHELLRVHQVRYEGVDLLPHDIAWNATGVLLLLAGAALARGRRAARP